MLVISYNRSDLRVGRKMTAEIVDANGSEHKVTFVVVRKGTYQEWLQCYIERGGSEEYLEKIGRLVHKFPKHFYEILTD